MSNWFYLITGLLWYNLHTIKTYSFKVFNSMVFGIFTEKCYHYLNLIFEDFHHQKETSHPLAVIPFPSMPWSISFFTKFQKQFNAEMISHFNKWCWNSCAFKGNINEPQPHTIIKSKCIINEIYKIKTKQFA